MCIRAALYCCHVNIRIKMGYKYLHAFYSAFFYLSTWFIYFFHRWRSHEDLSMLNKGSGTNIACRCLQFTEKMVCMTAPTHFLTLGKRWWGCSHKIKSSSNRIHSVQLIQLSWKMFDFMTAVRWRIKESTCLL